MSRNERALLLGRTKLEQEANIVNIVQQNRYFKSAIRQLLSKAQQTRLMEKSLRSLIYLSGASNNSSHSDENCTEKQEVNLRDSLAQSAKDERTNRSERSIKYPYPLMQKRESAPIIRTGIH